MVRTWEREGEVGRISRFSQDRRVKGRRPEEKYLGSLRVRGSERARGGPASETRRGARGLSANCAAARGWVADWLGLGHVPPNGTVDGPGFRISIPIHERMIELPTGEKHRFLVHALW